MREEKQIEEMAKIFCGMKNGCDGCMWDKVHCNERNCAEEIYNAGYRKQRQPFSCGHEKGEWISVDEDRQICAGQLTTFTEALLRIKEAPTADVVPRAEVEKIFAEIEKSVASLEYRANTPRKTVNIEEVKAQCDWILHEVIPKTLAELKKKYTEGER